MEPSVLQEIVWIKWALVVIAGALSVIAVFAIFALRAIATVPEMVKGRVSFAERAKAMLDQGTNDKLLELCDAHVLEFPADAHGYWYMGQANYRLGHLRQALACFRKVIELQPDWEAVNTQPMIAAIEAKLAERGEKPDLKVVSVDTTPELDPSPGAPRKA
jgi:cytochrome c-type biogenesis protein CcmH/NrfG